MVYQYIALTASFFLTACLVVLADNIIFGPRRAVTQRLSTYTSSDAGTGGRESAGRSSREETLYLLGLLGRVISGRSYLEKLQQKLVQAHIWIRAEEFVGFSFICGAAGALLLFMLTGNILVAAAGGFIGFKIPRWKMEAKKNRRANLLNRQLPDALTIISSGLRAGFSFPQAVAVVSREMDPPIAEEFDRVNRENRLGKPMADVLRELSARNDSDDLRLVVTSLLIQRQVGGNLAEVLDNIAQTIRERVRIKGEIKTLTAQGKITAVIISLLPVVVAGLILLVNPDYVLTLIREPLGLIMACVAVLLQILGIVIVRRIINIQI